MSSPRNYSPCQQDALIMSIQTMQGRRKIPITHPAVEAPLCKNCAAYGLCFFDLDCSGCLEVIKSRNVNVAQLFAVIRQWTRPVQIQLEEIIEQMFEHGANVNDRDGLTDMTLLQYAAKSGAHGNEELATRVTGFLLDEGAHLEARCKWTDMTALHYAVYFDVASTVELLLDRGADIRASCSELCRGGCLHIAAAQLALDSARVLVKRGADRTFFDCRGRTPYDCLPSPEELPENLTTLRNNLAILLCPPTSPQEPPNPNKLRTPESGVFTPLPIPIVSAQTIQNKNSIAINNAAHSQMSSPGKVSAKVTLQALGLCLSDRVTISPGNGDPDEERHGVLRYCGPVEFADGVWAGVEVSSHLGRNDGSVDGVRYFFCSESTAGVFCPITRLRRRDFSETSGSFSRRPATPRHALDPKSATNLVIHHGSVDVSGVSAKIDTGLGRPALECGDRVLVAGQRKGTVRFVGPTEFAQGLWYGIELDKAVGKNDGAVSGVRYFTCGAGKGVFAPLSRLQKLRPRTGLSTAQSGFRRNSRVAEDSSSRHSSLMTSSQMEDCQSSARHSPNQLDKSDRLTSTAIMTTSAIATSHSPSYFGDASGDMYLREGLQVLCNNELGVVRFIGATDFAEGVWVGVELRHSRGRNDGTVNNRRYFICADQHGIMVRPSKVSVRGINGSRLLPPELAALHNETLTMSRSQSSTPS